MNVDLLHPSDAVQYWRGSSSCFTLFATESELLCAILESMPDGDMVPLFFEGQSRELRMHPIHREETHFPIECSSRIYHFSVPQQAEAASAFLDYDWSTIDVSRWLIMNGFIAVQPVGYRAPNTRTFRDAPPDPSLQEMHSLGLKLSSTSVSVNRSVYTLEGAIIEWSVTSALFDRLRRRLRGMCDRTYDFYTCQLLSKGSRGGLPITRGAESLVHRGYPYAM